MIVKVYFRDGEYISWYSNTGSQAPDLWWKMMKEWMPGVAESSYAWATAALTGQDFWMPDGSDSDSKLPYNPLRVLAENDVTISTLDVDAVYIVDEDDDEVLMYYIHPDSHPSRILPQHYENAGNLMDLRHPLFKMITEYEYKKSGDNTAMNFGQISHPDKEYKKYFRKLWETVKQNQGELTQIASKKHIKFKISLAGKSKIFICPKTGEINSLKNVVSTVDKFLIEALS